MTIPLKGPSSQVDALAKLRRGGEQRVVVEHVHINAGGQAIVAAVTHTGDPTRPSKTEDNPVQRVPKRTQSHRHRAGSLLGVAAGLELR